MNSISWTQPRTWIVNEFVTATLLNTHLRDNLLNAHYEYGTTLPGSPSDGQLAMLVDSTTVPTYRWAFRYNDALAANKWEFIGGTPQTSTPLLTIAHANLTTYRFSSTLLTVLRTGIYDTVINARNHNGGSGQMYTIGVNAAADDTHATPAPGTGSMYFLRRRTFTAGDQLSLAYRVTVGSTTYTLTEYELRILPVQVS